MSKIWFVLVLALAGCKKDKEPPAAVADAAVKLAASDAAVPVPTGPDAGPDLTGRPRYALGNDEKISAELLEKLYAAMAECPLIWSGFDTRFCPEATALQSAVWGGEHRWLEGDYSAHSKLTFEVGKKMLTHASASVRYAAVNDVFLKNNEEGRIAVAETIAREQDPKVLRPYAEMIANNATFHPKLAEQVLRLADHPDAEVRRATFMRGFGSSRGIAGAYELAAKHAESDPDADARRYACEAAGELGDPRAMDLYAKLLVPETDRYLYDSCLAGLIAMWMDDENAHEPAYRRTLEIIAAPHPPEASLAALWNLGGIPEAMKERPDEWKSRKFVKIKDLQKALVDFASSEKEDVYAREGMIDTLVNLGAGKKVFKAIRKTVPAKPADDTPLFYFAQKLDETISAAK